LREKNIRNQKRIDLRKERDRKANRAKDKKVQRLQRKCKMLEAKLKLMEKAPRCIDEIDVDRLLKDVVRKNAAAGPHVPIDIDHITTAARELSNGAQTGGGGAPSMSNIFDKFRFEDFAREQVHNANCKPQGRRFSEGLFDWCLSIFKTNKHAYREFVKNSPELYLPSERTLQYIQAQRKNGGNKKKVQDEHIPGQETNTVGMPTSAVTMSEAAEELPTGGLQQAIVEADTGMQMGDVPLDGMVHVTGAHA